MSAFDELEGQLMQSVAAYSRARSGPAASLGRWWRTRVWHGGPIATVPLGLALAMVTAGIAANVDRTGESPAVASRSLSARAFESRCGPCRTLSDQLHGPMAGERTSTESRSSSSLTRQTRDRRGLPVVVWSRQEAEVSTPNAGAG